MESPGQGAESCGSENAAAGRRRGRYVRLFDAPGRTEGDGPTIGLILGAEKSEGGASYSTLHEHELLFAAKHVPYLPGVVERELERDRRVAEVGEATRLATTTRRTSHRKGARA